MREKLKRILQSRFEFSAYSRLGFASFILALLCGVLVIIEISFVLRFQNSVIVDQFRVVDPWLTWFIVLLAVTGIVLGLASTAQKQKRRVFGMVGLIFNGFFLLGIFFLYLSNIIAFWKLAAAAG